MIDINSSPKRARSSEIRSRGRRLGSRLDSRLKKARKSRYYQIDLEGLESRTLLATIPAITATAGPVNLSNLSTVTSSGNANSPTVAIDPYDSDKLFAVWGVDLSTLSPVPHTTAIVDGAYSNNGGTSWTPFGEASFPVLDAATIDATPPTAYTQVTDPSLGFDGHGNVYLLTMQTSGATDGALVLNKFNFSGPTPSPVALANGGIVDRWLGSTDGVNSAVLAVDSGTYPNSSPTGTPPAGVPQDNFANNVYIAWASTDINLANPFTPFNANRPELIVSSNGGNSFSGETIANVGPNSGPDFANFGPQDDSHPQLVINSNDSGQVTVGWDDFGTGSTASPKFDLLMSNFVQAGDSYGFTGNGGIIGPGLTGTPNDTPVTTPFSDAVNNLSAGVTGLTVTVNLIHPTVGDLSLVLQAPNNGPSIPLLLNATNAAGAATGGGVAGANLGVFGETNTNPGVQIGTVFDDNATRDIFDPTPAGANGVAAPAIGHFRPESFESLDAFLQQVANDDDLNGTWTLEITDFRTESTPGDLLNFTLQFTTGMTQSSPESIASTLVPGALGNTFPTAVPSTPQGAGPGLVLAIDNTLGPNSPFRGRIYAAYVGYEPFQDVNGHVNPTTNTDIYLAYYDPSTQNWVQQGVVNDDNSAVDGYSSADLNTGTFGRTQFQPAIAVDQATGTLVISWRDARDDAANARVATYITTSIDGGNSFSAQTYANPENTAIDAITGQRDVLGPQSDNQSGGNAQRDAAFGYGNQMGLAVFDGQVYPIWAGNFNQSYDNNGTVTAVPLNIWYRPMVIAAGPRIIDSSMGPIPLAEAASGSVSISVTFDRSIIPSTFGIGNVTVYYHDTTANSDPFISLDVTGVSPVPGTGNTQFTVTFDPSLNAGGTDSGIANFTGTYSYLIAPDAGPGTIPISSPVWSFVNGALQKYDPDDQNADGSSDENALRSSFTGETPGDVYAVPAPQIGETSYLGAQSILRPTFGLNPNTLPLIVPGPQVLSTSVPGGDAASGNLVTDGTTSSFNLTFDRPMLVNTAAAGQTPTPGSFTAADVLSIMGPTGSISEPQYFPSDVQTGQMISGTLDSTLTIPSFGGTFTVGDITVSLTAAFSPDSDLSAVLIAPNGMQVPLFSGVGGNGSNFINTVFDDAAETSITTGTAPFTGTYRPEGPAMLSSLDGLPVDFKNSFGLWVPGVWTLQLTSSAAGVTGTLDNWSLSITPQISVAPVASSENQNGTAATSFTIGFPRQQLSGTYTIQIGPGILDTFGDALDTTQTAGLAVLRDTGPKNPTTTVNYGANDLPKAIPAPTGTAAGSVSSTITVPDNFIIQGDTTTAGVSGLRVEINLSYPDDPDLSATLSHYNSSGLLLASVPLFTNVGSGFNTANFTDTVFDDNSSTPIQQGAAPFFATFAPQESLATAFAGSSAQGTWTLVIQNSPTGSKAAGTFSSWSLSFQEPLPTSGLGEPGSDDFTGSFRIFTLSQVDALSSQEWTAVGPASIGEGSGGNAGSSSDPSGRVTGLAIDPSDPSGNTVYAAGASGGIWKTTDFLTTNPGGPTWIPLTDFGPTSGVNIGGIAVFPRNHNPNQSIVIAATGEGDTGTPGVGFLISQDGGATWNLYDSSDNVDNAGNLLPINAPQPQPGVPGRDRVFVGDTAFQVVVDPNTTPSGGVIIYAALSGPTGGIWRSEDTGETWELMLSGQATSVVLAPESNVQGNLQVVYAAIRGTGVFMSPNQGQVWNQLTGDIGNPLIFDDEFGPSPNVNPVNGPGPNGGEGRIALAVPNATGNAAQDAVYEGWLYAIVSNPAGALDGIFVTKDFGQNWTQVRIPTEPNEGYQTNPAIPANDVGLSDFPIIGSAMFPQGNYNIAIAVDPTDPSVIYVGGTKDGNQSGLIRINLTNIWDAHALVAYSYDANDGGKLTLASTGPAAVAKIQNGVFPSSYLNFIRSPQDPFEGDASLYVFNYSQFTNNGAGVEWVPFDMPGTDYHRIATMIDPTTGLPRLIFGNDQGVWSVLDDNGTFETQIGSSDMLPNISRNGNLQITQFYYGAAQPSNAAAEIAGSLFYGSAQDNGGPSSNAGVISNGNIVWNGPGGDASGVATDQQGNGTVYQYFWPCCGGGDTDFFQVNGVGRTTGLLQASGGQPTPDPQWPFTGGANFAVNPVNGKDVVISSAVGRIFTTTNAGVTWFDVGDPPVFNSPGTFSVALAYGAPDPGVPGGVGNLGNFIYVGTGKGQIYVTQDGGGSGTSNNWLNISLGLDGSAVKSIITDPTRGSHDAYAVTTTGVFYLADSILLGNNPANTAYEWVNITGNLKKLAYPIFGQAYNPTTDPNSTKYTQPVSLSSIIADWRYAIPNSTSYAHGPTDHPVLYVGANSGVYQSLDGGNTWTLFPDTTYGAVVEGGYLPRVSVTSLSLALGNIDPNTGMPDLAGPYNPNPSDQIAADPDVLMAAAYGQGEFAINLPPLILGNDVAVTPTTGGTGPGSLPVVDGPITISGSSETSGFGNATWITIEDVTDPAAPKIVGGFNPASGVPAASASNSTNALGNFSIPFDPDAVYSSNGVKTIEIFATDNAGSVGNIVTYSFDFVELLKLTFPLAGEPVATATAGQNFAAPSPVLVDADDTLGNLVPTYNGPVTLALANNATGTFVGTLTVNAVNGVATFSNLAIDTAGTYELEATSSAPIPATTPGISSSITIVAAAPAQLVWATEPPSVVTENFALGAAVVVEDQFGNPVTGYTNNVSVTLDLNGIPDNSELSGTTTVAADGTTATFSNIIIDAIGNPYTLIASSESLTSPPSTGIDVVAPQLVVTSQPTAAVTAGTAFALTVNAETYLGAIDTAVNGTLALAIDTGPAGATIMGSTSATVSSGVATFGNVILDTAGAYVLQVSGANSIPGDTNTITVVAQATAAGLFIKSEPPPSVQAGAGFGLGVEAVDQFGNPTTLSGKVSVAISNNPGGSTLGGTTTVTASGNLATFSGLTLNKVGTDYTLVASSGTLSTATTSGINVTPAPASQLVIPANGEPPASVVAGQSFSMVVDAEDPFGNLVPNFIGSVTIAVPSNVMGTTTVNAVSGVATFPNLAIDTAGTYELQATSNTLSSATSTSVTVTSTGQAASLVWATEPPGQVFQLLGFGATVEVKDQFGNVDTSYDGPVTVALDNNPGNAVLGGTTTVTASSGVATFSGLTINVIGNNYTLLATGDSLTTPASTAIDVSPLPAVGLEVTTQPPTSVQAGQSFGLSVSVLDQFGTPDPDFNGSVTVGLQGNGTLGGTTTVSAISGIATFSGLTLDEAGNHTLQVSSAGLTSVTTGNIDVTPAAASQLIAVSEPPGSLTAGTTFGFEVQAEDPFGNLATGFNGTLTAALSANAGNATLVGPVTAVANSGVAFFAGLTVDQAGSGYKIQVTSGSLTPVTTTAFSVTPAAAAQLGIPQPPTSITAGAPFDLSVAVEDQYGNVVTTSDAPVTIALSKNPAAGTLNGVLIATASNGVAAFSGLTLDTAASGYTIQATSTGLTSATTSPFDVAPAAASTLVLSIPPPATMVAGHGFGLAVEAEDPFGNLATSFTGTVTFALENNPGNTTLMASPPTALTVTAIGGVANSHDFYTIDIAASGYTIEASSPNLTSVTSASITVLAGPATNLAVKTQPPSSVAAGSSFGFVVAAEDPFGNVDTNFDRQVSVAPPAGSGASLAGSTTVTASAGLASFTGLTLSGATTPVSLQVAGTGLTGTATNPVSLVSPAQIEFATGSVNVVENAGVATIQVVRSGGLPGTLSVNVATSGGTAVAGVNYTPINQVVNFAAGVNSQTVSIPVINAGTLAQPLTVNVVLSSPVGGASLGSPSTATLTILNVGQTTTPPPPITLDSVQLVKNKKHQVTEILLGFSGALNPMEAASTAEYSLVIAGKRGSFTTKNAKRIKLKSAVYNPANDSVALMTKKPFGLTKPVQLTVDGLPPSGLEDSYGRLIDGNDDGQPGSNAVAILTGKRATISALKGGSAAVDLLLEHGELAALPKARRK